MTKLLAHRGFSGKYPENTMLAFEKAIEAGCDGLEFDVQLTSDGVPVIIHDLAVDRTTDGSGPVASFSYDAIRKLNAGYTCRNNGTPVRIPNLEELLGRVKNTEHTLNIELKNSLHYYAGLEETVISMIRRYKLEKRCVLSSFNHVSIVKCREIAPEIAGSMITSSILFEVVAYLKKAGAAGLQCRFNPLTGSDITHLRKNGIVSYLWTPNTFEDILSTCEIGADYIITDHADLYHKAIAQLRQASTDSSCTE